MCGRKAKDNTSIRISKNLNVFGVTGYIYAYNSNPGAIIYFISLL